MLQQMGDRVRLFLSAQGEWGIAPKSHEERGQWVGGSIVGWDLASDRVAVVMENDMKMMFTFQNLLVMRAREASGAAASQHSGAMRKLYYW